MNHAKRFFVLIIVLCALFLHPALSFAQSPDVKADQVYLDFGSGTWVAEGNVDIKYKDYEFVGDKAQYAPDGATLSLFNGRLTGNDIAFKATKIILKRADGTISLDAFTVRDGSYKGYTFSCNELYSSGDSVSLSGNAVIGNASTTMSGDKFVINMKTGKIEGTNVKSKAHNDASMGNSTDKGLSASSQ